MRSLPESTGIVILAAGSSSRLGRPKQLLKYKGNSLIRLTVAEAIKMAANNVIVVSGASRQQVEGELEGLAISLVYNPEWEEGMASSIRCGVAELLKNFPDIQNVILAVCDQPFVNAAQFESLLKEKIASGKDIVASAYKNTLGVPALFDRKYFQELLLLTGQQGAKKLLDTFSEDVSQVPFPEGNIDIDTIEDYESLDGI